MAYKILPGDTLSGIAKKTGTSISALQQLNNIKNPNLIYAGASLNLPGAPSSPAPQTPSAGAAKIISTPSIKAMPGAVSPGTSGNAVSPSALSRASSYSPTPATPARSASSADYSDKVMSIYQQNFGRNPTQAEINDQNTALNSGRLTIDALNKWAAEHPENVAMTGRVSNPQSFQGDPLAGFVYAPKDPNKETPDTKLPEQADPYTVTQNSLKKYIEQYLNQPNTDYGAEAAKAREGYQKVFGTPESRIATASEETKKLYEDAKQKALTELKGSLATRGLLSSGVAEKEEVDLGTEYTKKLSADLSKLKQDATEKEQTGVWDLLSKVLATKENETSRAMNLLPEILKLNTPITKIDGSAESGFYSMTIDPNTGKVLSSTQIIPPVAKAQSMTDKYGSGAIGEYNFYVNQEIAAGRKPMSWNEYQNLDANRKRAINNTYNYSAGYTPGVNTAVDSWVKNVNEGRAQLSDVPANLKSAVAEGLAATKPTQTISPYQEERMIRNLQSITDLRNRASGWNTGWGSLFAGIPASDARAFKADIDTLKANITFGELTAMREASKTGGALGQVSDRENALLGAALGSLDVGQSKAEFLNNLTQIEDSINRWKEAAAQLNQNPQPSQMKVGNDVYILQSNGKYIKQ